MAYADGCRIGRRAKLELLSPNQVARIHAATLDVLENVGVRFRSRRALRILSEHGAEIDYETSAARLPADLIERTQARCAPPVFTAIVCTVSPLHQERFGMDPALTLAEAGIPISFYPMPILGATAPATVAGAAVVNNAELVSATALVQLAFPGAKVFHGGGPTAMHVSTAPTLATRPMPCCCARSRGRWPTTTACRPGWGPARRRPRRRSPSRPTRTPGPVHGLRQRGDAPRACAGSESGVAWGRSTSDGCAGGPLARPRAFSVPSER